jgi:hypothetical protein
MNNLTKNQLEIIESLKNEFVRINESIHSKDKFNLIDVDELIRIKAEIKNNLEEKELDGKYWNSLAMEEAERVAKLLQEDLPNASVERYGKSNGKYDAPNIIIQRCKGLAGHHENFVSIEIAIDKETKELSHGCSYSKGVRLLYVYNKVWYSSIEKLFSNSKIGDEIRNKIL